MPDKQGRDFDAAAAGWDDEPRRVQLARDIAAAIRTAISLEPQWDVLDLGCGTGLLTLALRPWVKSITGIDSSVGMLAALEAKVCSSGVDNVDWQRVDLDSAEPLPGRYHLIVSAMTLHHIRDVPAMLKRLSAALHPGGWVALADLTPEGGQFHDDNTGVFHFGFDPAAFEELLHTCGLEAVELREATRVRRERSGVAQEFAVFLATACKPR